MDIWKHNSEQIAPAQRAQSQVAHSFKVLFRKLSSI